MLVARAASLACVLEVSAEKVGNVTPSRGFADANFEDFVANAFALGPAIARAEPSRVGWAVYQAVATTRRLTSANTHLGVALLLAPLAAAWRGGGAGTLRRRLAAVLRGLSVDDARWAYRAIRLANPGGLGSSGQADIRRTPRITLREAMALAKSRDAIAAEYARDFALTFTVVLPALRQAMRHGLNILQAIVQAHLEIMAHTPDTLIARKAGEAAAAAVAAKARAVIRVGGVRTPKGRAAVRRLDRALRVDGNRLNPGTSADLVAAALFTWLLEADGTRLG
jgi:triphosphoribosyl-dephospho-CoA synthase